MQPTQAQMRAMRRRDKEMIPPVLLWGMFAVALSSLALTSAHVLSGRENEGQKTWAPIVAEAPVAFVREGRSVHVIGEGLDRMLDGREAGFIDAYADALRRKRQRGGVDEATPVRVIRFEDGRIVVVDDATGWRIDPKAFGPDSERVFAAFVD